MHDENENDLINELFGSFLDEMNNKHPDQEGVLVDLVNRSYQGEISEDEGPIGMIMALLHITMKSLIMMHESTPRTDRNIGLDPEIPPDFTNITYLLGQGLDALVEENELTEDRQLTLRIPAMLAGDDFTEEDMASDFDLTQCSVMDMLVAATMVKLMGQEILGELEAFKENDGQSFNIGAIMTHVLHKLAHIAFEAGYGYARHLDNRNREDLDA